MCKSFGICHLACTVQTPRLMLGISLDTISCDMAQTSFWKRLKSRFWGDDYSVEPWEGAPVFEADLPDSDASGIEFMNDDKTPMEFVIAVLARCLHLSRRDATESMLRIHFKGSVKFGRMRHSVAEELADHIRTEISKSGYPLKIRVCDGQTALAPEPLTKEDII